MNSIESTTDVEPDNHLFNDTGKCYQSDMNNKLNNFNHISFNELKNFKLKIRNFFEANHIGTETFSDNVAKKANEIAS